MFADCSTPIRYKLGLPGRADRLLVEALPTVVLTHKPVTLDRTGVYWNSHLGRGDSFGNDTHSTLPRAQRSWFLPPSFRTARRVCPELSIASHARSAHMSGYSGVTAPCQGCISRCRVGQAVSQSEARSALCLDALWRHAPAPAAFAVLDTRGRDACGPGQFAPSARMPARAPTVPGRAFPPTSRLVETGGQGRAGAQAPPSAGLRFPGPEQPTSTAAGI